MKYVKHLLTGIDNETADAGRIALLVGLISFVYFSYISVNKSDTFDLQAFGIGYSAICAGVGALLKLKENTEPKAGE